MDKQVNKEKYLFSSYCNLDRWSSYWYQLNEILRINPEKMLEIGIGDKVILSYLRQNTQIKHTSADIAQDLNPDIICSIDSLPFDDNSFDLVCAFEVLEHLPWENLPKALSELHRVSAGKVLISLPHWGRHFSISFRIPFFKEIKIQWKCNFFPIEHKFNGQHYWEIGKRGFSLAEFKKVITSAGFKVENDYVAFQSPYHHFFILEK